MTFITGKELDNTIRALLKSKEVRCAVAFWGFGASELLRSAGNRNIRIICNLRSGATNPGEIEKLEKSGILVLQNDSLHAKVYINDKHAVVTSANVSSNGLGLEGNETARWIEAGVLTSDIRNVNEWFEDLWVNSRAITKNDLREAKRTWKLHRKHKPTASFRDYDIEVAINSKSLPLVSWYDYSDWTANEESVKRQIGLYDDTIEDRINNSIDIEHEADSNLFKDSKWVLQFRIKKDNRIAANPGFYWTYSGPFIRKAFYYDDNKKSLKDCVLEAESTPPIPFNTTDRIFQKAFKDIIEDDKYKTLLDDMEKNMPWFKPRKNKMVQFWRDLHKHYMSMCNE